MVFLDKNIQLTTKTGFLGNQQALPLALTRRKKPRTTRDSTDKGRGVLPCPGVLSSRLLSIALLSVRRTVCKNNNDDSWTRGSPTNTSLPGRQTGPGMIWQGVLALVQQQAKQDRASQPRPRNAACFHYLSGYQGHPYPCFALRGRITCGRTSTSLIRSVALPS